MDEVSIDVVCVSAEWRAQDDPTVVVGQQVVEPVLEPVLRALGRLRCALRLVGQLTVLVLTRDTRLVVVDLSHLPTVISTDIVAKNMQQSNSRKLHYIRWLLSIVCQNMSIIIQVITKT